MARSAMTATVAEMATELQGIVGQRLVAYVTGSRSSRAVGQWAKGDGEPSREEQERLRALYRTVLILAEREAAETIRAWLAGANPYMGDEVPAEVLRAGDSVRVYRAARAFVDD